MTAPGWERPRRFAAKGTASRPRAPRLPRAPCRRRERTRDGEIGCWPKACSKDGHGETLRALYLNSTRIAGPDAVPQGVRYRLAEIALAQHDMKLAAALLEGPDRAAGGRRRDNLDSVPRPRAGLYRRGGRHGAAVTDWPR